MNKYKKQSKEARKKGKLYYDCERKVAYETPTEFVNEGLELYMCPHCKKYHHRKKVVDALKIIPAYIKNKPKVNRP
jgi:NMD protein affecting ribosome stability and mRNA decay